MVIELFYSRHFIFLITVLMAVYIALIMLKINISLEKNLTQEDIKREVIALQDMGHKRLALETGEDPVNNPIEYVLESIKIYL